MEDTLVSTELAELARKKGFDELCSYSLECSMLYRTWGLKRNSDDWTQLAIPTQSLLQKWLREKHEIDVIPMCNFYNGRKKDGYLYTIDRFVNNIHDGQSYDKEQLDALCNELLFNTYEEALEQGLFKALELLEDVQ